MLLLMLFLLNSSLFAVIVMLQSTTQGLNMWSVPYLLNT